MGGATGGCKGDNDPLTFAACTPQGVGLQQNSNSTSHSDISKPASSQNALFQTVSKVVIITPETL